MKFPPFVANARILRAAQNAPVMKEGERGPPVSILQGALLDLGYKLPQSIHGKPGQPDGIFGGETTQVLRKFQSDNKLQPDGAAGRDTLECLDALLVAKFGVPQPSPAVLPPVMPVATVIDRNYRLGVGDPVIAPDPGAGPFNTTPAQASMWSLKQAILEILPPRGFSAVAFIGWDAAMNMKHYLDASGRVLAIDLEGMVASGATATARFKNEVRQAQLFVEKLPVGSHVFTSSTAESAYNFKHENTNWYFAVGGYSTWGKGSATVRNNAAGKECEMQFEYRFYDRYNWDNGKAVTIAGITITDRFMGEFHRQGLAREFDMVGSIKRVFRWQRGGQIPTMQFEAPGWR